MPTALVVDDNSENRYLLECVLSANGFDVVSASNGSEALERANEQLPDLLLSDILMPVMDGFSLCRRWKQSSRLKSVPFVFYTATYTDPKDQEFALSLGADLFVVKPAEPGELIRLVQEVIQRRAAGSLCVHTESISDETPYLRQYNEVLIRKLEDKLVEVEKANQGLLTKEFAIECSRTGIAMADLSGRFNYVNASFTRMWSDGNKELPDQDLALLFPDPRQLSIMLTQLNDSGHWSGQLGGQGSESGSFIALVEIHKVLGAQGAPLCLMIACSDTTEQERMRRELQRTQRLESLSQFAAGIAHDFNNLLTAIFAGLSLSDEQQVRNEDVREQQSISLSAFERAKELTQRLLNFGKGGTVSRRTVDVRVLIEESCQLALSGSGTRLLLELSGALWHVHASGAELSQVFCNIILNARQAMQDAGSLHISADNRTIEATDATDLAPGDYVQILFRDTGPGIEPTVLEHIFEPFFTSKPKGTGLGLATSHGIVRDHGGRVTVTASPGAGATFSVWLPALRNKVVSSIPRRTLDVSRGSGRILVLDDDDQIRRIASLLLQRQGYQVTTASTGEQAIELYGKALAARLPFDLLILDLTVRGGMGGEATLAALRKLDPEVVALASSGHSDAATAAHLTTVGFAGMLAKPYLAHELYSTVKAAIAPRPR